MTEAVPWWASDDPWAMSPDEQAALDERRRHWAEECATTPETPPY